MIFQRKIAISHDFTIILGVRENVFSRRAPRKIFREPRDGPKTDTP